MKYIKTLKKKKTTGTNIVILEDSQLGHLAPEVEIDGDTISPPATDAGVIHSTTEQTNSVAGLHSEPRAPVSGTFNSTNFEQPIVRSVVRVSRFRRKIESRRLLRQSQRGCDEEFDRIIEDEREICRGITASDMLAEEGLYEPVPPPPQASEAARAARPTRPTTAQSRSSCLSSDLSFPNVGFKSSCES